MRYYFHRNQAELELTAAEMRWRYAGMPRPEPELALELIFRSAVRIGIPKQVWERSCASRAIQFWEVA